MIPKILTFINRDIWRIPSRQLKGPRGFLVHSLRVLIKSFRQFASDRCALHASALTFFSLLSIVPVFAMAFGIAKGFGMDVVLKQKLVESTQGQQEIFSRVFEFSENMLQNTKGGLIAGIGLALLFWTIIQVLSNIENAFNSIMGIKKQRTLGRKFSDYLSLMLIAPVFFVFASSFTVFVASQVTMITERISILGVFAPVIFLMLKLFPLLIFAGLLTYLYLFLPNGRIDFRSALLGGTVAGIVYQVVQWAYIYFQIGVSKNGAIYGTFAALPLFLVWLQLSWQIVLYGAVLAFAHQNEQKFEFEQECLSASTKFKKLLALRITQVCVGRFAAGQEPLSDQQIAELLEAPVRLVRELLFQLVQANILILVRTEEDRDRFYQPARDVSEMTIAFVIQELEKTGTEDIPLLETPELKKLRESLLSIESGSRGLPGNALLKDLLPNPAKT